MKAPPLLTGGDNDATIPAVGANTLLAQYGVCGSHERKARNLTSYNTLYRISGSYSLANQSVSRLASHVFDTRRSLTTNVVNTEVPTTCGWSITLDGSYTARTVLVIEIHGITDLGGPDVKYDSRNHQQGACDPCEGAATARVPGAGQYAPRFDMQKDDRPVCGGGSPGGGSGLTCVEVFTDHYWYYPDTGHIEYRFTTVEQYCFNAT